MKRFLILLIFLPLFGYSQIKVSEMTSATSVNDADYFLLVQSGSSKKVPYSVFKNDASDVGGQIRDTIDNIMEGGVYQIPVLDIGNTGFDYNSNFIYNGTSLKVSNGINDYVDISTSGIIGYLNGVQVYSINPDIGNFSGPAAYQFDTESALTSTNLFSLRNNTVEKFYINSSGIPFAPNLTNSAQTSLVHYNASNGRFYYDTISNLPFSTQSALNDTASAIRGDIPSVSFGTEGQIPYTNIAGDGWNYSDNIIYYTGTPGSFIVQAEANIYHTGTNASTLFADNNDYINLQTSSGNTNNYSSQLVDTTFINMFSTDGDVGDGYEAKILIDYFNGVTLTSYNNDLNIKKDTLKIGVKLDDTPLIYGEFDKDYVKINDSLGVNKSLILGESISQNHNAGKLYYDTIFEAATFYNDLPNFSHHLGYNHVARYYNNTGGAIQKGTLLVPWGQKINGTILPTPKIAGIGSRDSLRLIGMSATTTNDGEFGVVTLFGPIFGLNTSAFNDNDLLYADFNGGYTNVSPSPPYYSRAIGQVFYADNDSGSIYMFPQKIEFDPNPLFIADTSGISETVSIITQNVYEYIPISASIERENKGFIFTGDSAQVQVGGFYNIDLSLSFKGNPSAETWQYGVFVNGVLQHYKERSTSSSASGDVKVSVSRELTKNDWISFKIRNISGTGDPVVVTIATEILFIHE